MKKKICVLLAFLFSAGEGSSTTLGTNLITNGDASNGTTGWTITPDSSGQGICVTTLAGQATTAGLPAGVTIGVNSFWGCGTGASRASTKLMSQQLNLSDLASMIDSGLIAVDWATLLQTRSVDTVTATLRFLDASSNQIGSRTYTDANTASFDWNSITDTFALASGTRFVDVMFSFQRPFGFSTDAFADNISLVLRQTDGGTSTVPEPGTLALLGLGLAGLGMGRRRKAN